MQSNYEDICSDNIRRRGEEFDDIGRLISEQLYSDRTHFVYELLQNAEDALGRRKRSDPKSRLPTRVTFLLYRDRLEFRHFGEVFNVEDVKGISDVLKGTKANDRSQIGKFGIGFKSVYAFTSTPEIHSGDEHFVIERYIRPRATKGALQTFKGETVFVFPFNHRDLPKQESFQMIGEKLQKIGSRVLLFLGNITEIGWRIEDQDWGEYLKDSEELEPLVWRVTVIGEHEESELEQEDWLLFKRPLSTNPSFQEAFVELAFRLIESNRPSGTEIRRIDKSPLVVYFPTKVETGLGFLVQGPYDTTASRSDIEDTERNRNLIGETAELLSGTVLPWLREAGYLTINCLEALPINPDAFPKDGWFRAIYDRVRLSLHDGRFLLTSDGEFIAGKHAVLARGEEIVRLISPGQISGLLKAPSISGWLTPEITENRRELHRYLVGWKPSSYFEEEIESLIVAEVRPDDLVERITAEFLNRQESLWLIQFYSFFENRSALIEKLKNKAIVRLEDGSHIVPFRRDGSPRAFLPPEDGTEFPVVSREICSDENAIGFLKKLGLKEPDSVDEVIENVLPKYSTNVSLGSFKEHMEDIRRIEKAMATDSDDKRDFLRCRLQETSFVRTDGQGNDGAIYKKPGELYLLTDELRLYFSGNPMVEFVNSEYSEAMMLLLEDIGVANEIRVECQSGEGSEGYVRLKCLSGYMRGLKGFDPDIRADGLRFAVRNPSAKRSEIVWNKLAVKFGHCIQGTVVTSSRRDFSPDAKTHREKTIVSEFGRLLQGEAWLPSPNGIFVGPSELSQDDLPDSFIRDEKLTRRLGMKLNDIARIEHETGGRFIPAEEIEEYERWKAAENDRRTVAEGEEAQEIGSDSEIVDYGEEFERSFNRLGEVSLQDSIPNEGRVGNPELRRERGHSVHIERLHRELKPGEKRRRTVRTILEGPDEEVREYLSQLYSGKCQICGDTFPERNGNPYFVANFVVPRKLTRFGDTPANALCLCANHFAQWQHGAVEAENILEQIATFETEVEGGDGNPVLKTRICGEACEIRFREKHLLDLQELLAASNSD